MLNDYICEHYDIWQVGTMRRGSSYKHNIAVLVPKGTTITQDGVLPGGALIVDPWARSLGHPVESSLAVSEDKFVYKVALYPLVVNYNSANEKNLEETIREFRQENPNFEQRRAAAFAKIEIFGEEKPKTSPLVSL